MGKPRISRVSKLKKEDQFYLLRNMKCFPEIDRRIRLGWSLNDLADVIKTEFNELTDYSAAYIRKVLYEYRNAIPPAELSAVSPESVVGQRIIKRMANGLDELAELERLYRLQMERIEIGAQVERNTQLLFNTCGREVFIAMKLLKQSADLKMDLGLIKREPTSISINGQLAAEVGDRYGKDSVGRVIADPESRRKVLGIAERLLAIGAKASFDAVELLGKETGKQVIDAKVSSSELQESLPPYEKIGDGE